ncbi:MAG: sulfatase-like hydrolase/transferase [Rhodopirellula sp.]|nr:sulfatase-like hydrolase/transferase [Rhodopirellula sp.]
MRWHVRSTPPIISVLLAFAGLVGPTFQGVAEEKVTPEPIRNPTIEQSSPGSDCLKPEKASRPNILWITCEDMSPNLGCWGDRYATTPHIDRLANESVRYTNAFATAPVCSPTRSCLITGVYATTLGTQRLRSQFPIPRRISGFPAYLREAGYYTTNNVKTDYNTSNEPEIVRASWDACSGKAHWRNRGDGQPFFSVFNDMVTHQGPTSVFAYEEFQSKFQSKLAPDEIHDPATAPVPPYWPDTPITRRTVARYYDCITLMDKNVGRLLAEIDEAGLADETIVFFYSDHGAGLPRHKRLLLDSGMHVPLLIRFPQKYRHLAPAAAGETVDRLVSFVDFAPTVLSLLELPIPEYMQGEPFLGKAAGQPRRYVFGARDRVDEAYDLARSVRDKQYLYVRNYMPHLCYNQPEGFSDQSEVRREITRMAGLGKLNAAQLAYAGPTRPLEELYDTEKDPQQLDNLAGLPEYREVLERMRQAHGQWIEETRDLGFLSETDSRLRSEGATPYEMARQPEEYPQQRIVTAAGLVGRPDALGRQEALLGDADAAVRYWAAAGLRAQGNAAASAAPALRKALADPSAAVRIEAAGALVAIGDDEKALQTLATELQGKSADAAVHAARTLQLLGKRSRPLRRTIETVLRQAPQSEFPPDTRLYLRFSLEPLVQAFDQP